MEKSTIWDTKSLSQKGIENTKDGSQVQQAREEKNFSNIQKRMEILNQILLWNLKWIVKPQAFI